MRATTSRPTHITEPTAWMRGTAGAQLRRARNLGLAPDTPDGPIILAPLVGRLTTAGTEDDRRCDRCGRYVPPSEDYWPFLLNAAARLLLVGGLCTVHATAEGMRAQ